MEESELLRFSVEGYTPDTMPMARLASYLGELAALLGDQNSVHFVRLDAGSVAVAHKVDAEVATQVQERLVAVRDGHGPADAMRAYEKINEMLGKDGGRANLARSATGAVIIEFPGSEQTSQLYSGVYERGTIDGYLIRVGGKTADVPIILQLGRIEYSRIYASRATASELGKVLFQPVRLFGLGRWSRTTAGEWHLDRFRVDSFEVLAADRLSSVVADLRDVIGEAPIGLPSLAELRGGEAA